MKSVTKSVSVSRHLFITPLLLVAMATALPAQFCPPSENGVRKDYSYGGCCYLNNLKHNFTECMCDKSGTFCIWIRTWECTTQCCGVYPCGTPELLAPSETNPPWFEAGGFLAALASDECQGDHRDQTVEESDPIAPPQGLERPAQARDTPVESTSRS